MPRFFSAGKNGGQNGGKASNERVYGDESDPRVQHRATNGEPFPGKTERNWPTLVTTATTASRGNDRGIRLTILQHGPLVL